VVVAEKLPHAEVPHATVHLTPALALSFVTTAVRFAVVLTVNDAGGVPLKATEMVALIVIVAEAVLVPSLTEVATMVTVVAAEGAV
jgi:hypothetical protein